MRTSCTAEVTPRSRPPNEHSRLPTSSAWNGRRARFGYLGFARGRLGEPRRLDEMREAIRIATMADWDARSESSTITSASSCGPTRAPGGSRGRPWACRRRPATGGRGYCGGFPHPRQSAIRRDPDRLAHLIEATRLSEPSTSKAKIPKRARRPFQAELVGKSECSLGGARGGVTSAVQEVRTRDLRERLYVRGALGNGSSGARASAGSSNPRRIAQAGEQAGEHVHGVRRGGEIAPLLE